MDRRVVRIKAGESKDPLRLNQQPTKPLGKSSPCPVATVTGIWRDFTLEAWKKAVAGGARRQVFSGESHVRK